MTVESPVYEFDIVLSLNDTVASSEKDRSGLFGGDYFTPSTDTGRRLHTWLSGGNDNGNDNGKDKQEQEQESETEQQESKETSQEQVIEFPSNPGRTQSEILTDIAKLMRDIGIADKVPQYEQYLREKYGKALKDLSLDELQYQVANLQKCLQDEELRKQFREFLDGLKAA